MRTRYKDGSSSSSFPFDIYISVTFSARTLVMDYTNWMQLKLKGHKKQMSRVVPDINVPTSYGISTLLTRPVSTDRGPQPVVN